MNKKEKNIFLKDSIDLGELLARIWNNKKFIYLFSILFFVISFIYSFSLDNIYKSSVSFYPHYEENNNNSGNSLQSLAGLAGINLSSEVSSNIPPNLYPNLIRSTTFKNKILNEKVNYYGNNISYREHLTNNYFSIDLRKIIFYPLKSLSDFILHKQDIKELDDSGLIFISEDDYKLHKILDENININLNEQDGFIELFVIDKVPEISSTIAKKANDILQESIIDFKIKNVKELYNFTSSQLEIARNKLYGIEDSLANFKDSNRNIKSDLFLNQLERLETEYNIAKNIYNELAITKEKNAIDVRKNTPIFTIINPVVVPNEKHKPVRSYIILFFTFLGIVISIIWILIKKPLINIINEIKT